MKTSKSESRVTVSQDGPYLVSAEIPLSEQTILTDDDGGSERWSEAPQMQTRGDYALCRCGHSQAKPFCDGTHAKIGFDGSEAATQESYMELASVFDGPDIALMDVEQLCAFGRFCDLNGQVWNQVTKADDPEVRANFIRQVGNCLAGEQVVPAAKRLIAGEAIHVGWVKSEALPHVFGHMAKASAAVPKKEEVSP